MTSPISSTARLFMSSATRTYSSLTWSEEDGRGGGGEVSEGGGCGGCGGAGEYDSACSKISSLTSSERGDDFDDLSGSSDDGRGQKASGLGSDSNNRGNARQSDEHSSSDDQGKNESKANESKGCGPNKDGRPRGGDDGVTTGPGSQKFHRSGSCESKISNLSNSSSNEIFWADNNDNRDMTCSTDNLHEGSSVLRTRGDGFASKAAAAADMPHDGKEDNKQAEKKVSRKRSAATIDDDEEAASCFVYFARSVACSSSMRPPTSADEAEGGSSSRTIATPDDNRNKKRRKVTLISPAETESSSAGAITKSSTSASSRHKTFPEQAVSKTQPHCGLIVLALAPCFLYDLTIVSHPRQLIDMLDKEALSGASDSILCWMTDGKSFLVRDPERLCREILPVYFPHSKGCAKFGSFRRKLYRWGFKLRTECDEVMHMNGDNDDYDGSEREMTDLEYELLRHDSMHFYHKYFRRSDRRLCLRMKSVVAPRPKRRGSKKKKKKDEAGEIDEAKQAVAVASSSSSSTEIDVEQAKRRGAAMGKGTTGAAAMGTATGAAAGTPETPSCSAIVEPSAKKLSSATSMLSPAASGSTAILPAGMPSLSVTTSLPVDMDSTRMLPPPRRALSVSATASLASSPLAAAALAAASSGAATAPATAALTADDNAMAAALAVNAASSALSSAPPVAGASSDSTTMPMSLSSSLPVSLPVGGAAAACSPPTPPASHQSSSAQVMAAALRTLEEHQRQVQEKQTNELSEKIVRTIEEYSSPQIQPARVLKGPAQQRAQQRAQLAETIHGAVDKAMQKLARQEKDAMARIMHEMRMGTTTVQHQHQHQHQQR